MSSNVEQLVDPYDSVCVCVCVGHCMFTCFCCCQKGVAKASTAWCVLLCTPHPYSHRIISCLQARLKPFQGNLRKHNHLPFLPFSLILFSVFFKCISHPSQTVEGVVSSSLCRHSTFLRWLSCLRCGSLGASLNNTSRSRPMSNSGAWKTLCMTHAPPGHPSNRSSSAARRTSRCGLTRLGPCQGGDAGPLHQV